MDLRSPALYIGGKYYWVSRSQKFMTSTKIAEMVPISFPETALPCLAERARMTQAMGMRSPNALVKRTRDLFRAMSLAPRQKCPRNVVEMKGAMAAFFGSDSVAISCHCKRSKIILVKVLTQVCFLENIASWNWRKIALACIFWFSVIDVEIAGLHVEDMPKRWVIFAFFVYCMFRATQYKKKF